MEHHWLKREHNPKLVVFVLGWGADYRCVEHIALPGCDVVAIYDSRNIEPFDTTPFEGYARSYLFAWSFGVWVSEQIFPTFDFDRAVALNGTPLPLDDRYGLQPRRIMVTLHGIKRGGAETFNRRTYGEWYDEMEGLLSPRTHTENIVELEHLIKQSSHQYTPHICWDRAIVGCDDVIFPPENMVAYWGERAELLPLPHYPFGDPELIIKEIDNK